jgi:hypothetical protein
LKRPGFDAAPFLAEDVDPAGPGYAGHRSGPTSEELEEIRRLRAEVRDLKEANEILKAASSAPAFSSVESDAVADNLGVAAEGPHRHTRRVRGTDANAASWCSDGARMSGT